MEAPKRELFFGLILQKLIMFNNITDFRIGKAYYYLQNTNGSRLRLTLDYGKNTFTLKVYSDQGNIERLKEQAGRVAANLLGKKAKRNLAYKLVNYE